MNQLFYRDNLETLQTLITNSALFLAAIFVAVKSILWISKILIEHHLKQNADKIISNIKKHKILFAPFVSIMLGGVLCFELLSNDPVTCGTIFLICLVLDVHILIASYMINHGSNHGSIVLLKSRLIEITFHLEALLRFQETVLNDIFISDAKLRELYLEALKNIETQLEKTEEALCDALDVS